ncbi:hypothetical protein GJ496_000511 [Pomphorhynchus laevis]|nr:hypothetical protein GJ496_000511 [Pomphorhynchus laevis]
MSKIINSGAVACQKYTQTKLMLRLQEALVKRNIIDLKDYQDEMSRRFIVPNTFDRPVIKLDSGYYFTREPQSKVKFAIISKNSDPGILSEANGLL